MKLAPRASTPLYRLKGRGDERGEFFNQFEGLENDGAGPVAPAAFQKVWRRTADAYDTPINLLRAAGFNPSNWQEADLSRISAERTVDGGRPNRFAESHSGAKSFSRSMRGDR